MTYRLARLLRKGKGRTSSLRWAMSFERQASSFASLASRRNMQAHRFSRHLILPTLVGQHEHDEALLVADRHSFSSATTWQDERRTVHCPLPAPTCILCASSVSNAAKVGSPVPATVPRNIFVQSGDWQLLRPSLRYTRTRFSSQPSPVPCTDASVMLRLALNLRQ
jgi:hypothetical protein